MCSLAVIQPQFSLPLSHLASIWSAVRSQSHNANHKQPRINEQSCVATSPVIDVDVILSEHVKDMFNQLGFHNLESIVTRESIEDVLCSLTKPCALRHEASELHVSSATFFENKYGFPEKLLSRPKTPFSSWYQSHQNTSSLLARHQHLQLCQVRGFKTKHSGQLTGLGLRRTSIDDNIKSLKKSVFDRMYGASDNKSSEKFRSLMADGDLTPASQDKLKIAFAEGYMASVQKPSGSSLIKWLRYIVTSVFIMTVALLVFNILINTATGDMKINMLKGERFEVNPEEINVTFNDVKGVDEAKQELTDVVEFLRDPERFTALGAKLPKGVLLVGPPGVGKSLLARAIAGEAGVPFFYASGSEFDEIFVGTGAKRVRQLFDAAKSRTPCIVFIDEIDTVGAKRTSSNLHPHANQTINQLLSEMDGFQRNEGIIVLGATNRRDNLDKALLRPGRFDVEVQVGLPDLKGRSDILEHYLGKVKFGHDVDVDRIARGTTGVTGADLENLVNQAALKAAMDGASVVSMEEMEYARDKILMGPAKKTKILDEDHNKLTAYHEAGHTLVAMLTKDATPVNKVTIIPRGQSMGHTSFIPEKDEYTRTKAQLLAEMDVAMGGRVAEELIFGADKVTTGASSDFMSATQIAKMMVKAYGMSDKVGVRVFQEEGANIWEVGDVTTEVIDMEIKKLLQESYERARTILKTHQAELKIVAESLLKYETMDLADVKAVIEGKAVHRNGGFTALPTTAHPRTGIKSPTGSTSTTVLV